ncbi:hypothetical protein MMC25_002789 [Agyrium rufum]|nr:hypothetical protein [Agyrium rufum]
MYTSGILSTLALVGTVLAQGMINVQVVKVSNKDGDLVFSPNNIMAPPGSMVQFQFYPKNHSIVQAAFAAPCVPLNDVNSSAVGFFSGFMPATTGEMPVYTIAINDTSPIWFYCSQGKHCQAGMVGAINAPINSTTKNVANFAAAAKNAPQNLSPGQPFSNSSSSSSPSSSYGSSSPTTSSGSGSTSNSTSTSTGGAILSTSSSAASGSVFAGSRENLLSLGLAVLVASFMSLAL